jgi:hypothetical protein
MGNAPAPADSERSSRSAAADTPAWDKSTATPKLVERGISDHWYETVPDACHEHATQKDVNKPARTSVLTREAHSGQTVAIGMRANV